MSDADDVRAELDRVLSDNGTASAILNSLEHVVEQMKTTVTLVGFGSLDPERASNLVKILSRTMMEIGTMQARFQRIDQAVQEWRRAL